MKGNLQQDPAVEKLNVSHTTNKAITKSVTVWALIGQRGLIHWTMQEETMNAEQYMDNVIQPHVIPYFMCNPIKIFQQDGTMKQMLEECWIK